MSDQSIFAGPALRRLRKRENLTQATMSGRLGISPSYLNLIERNQRPVTARVLVKLIGEFAFDPRDLSTDASIGGVDGLVRRLSDDRFSDLGIDREEVDAFLSDSPQIASAFARLYDQAGRAHAGKLQDPVSACRRIIEHWQNHFSDLDHAAEALADELRLSRADLSVALTERLREKHQLSVRILPREVMPFHRRRLDLHARQIQLAEMMGPRSRAFHLAVQLADLEQREQIASLVEGSGLDDEAAKQMFARHLKSYFAAALIMPYGRFMRACESTGYDLQVLMRRFGVSYEQLAHRLTTLQRVGQRGLPFFMLRIDTAGQTSKSLSGASGATFVDADHVCPLWGATHAFQRSGEMVAQTVRVADAGGNATSWFCIARTTAVEGASGAEGRYSVVLGLQAGLSGNLALARGQDLRTDTATEIGPGCRHCHRDSCHQRALPPPNRRLAFDPLGRASDPFVLAGDAAS